MLKKVSIKIILAFIVDIVILSILYFVFLLFYKYRYIDFNGNMEFYINDSIHLECTSRYMIFLKGSFYIPEYVAEIGWNDEYVVVLQYDLIMTDNISKNKIPDKSKSNYYIIDLKENKMIGPLTLEEFNEYDCSSIKMKKTS